MTKYEVYQSLDWAIRYACVRVGVAEFGVIEHEELLPRIARANLEVYGLLTAFLNAYQAWFASTDNIIRAGKGGGKVTAEEYQKLQALTNQRDETRRRLAERLNTLPLR